MEIKLIAAKNIDGAIGKEGEVPWDVAGEQKHFKEETIGSPVIMGSNTFDSIMNKIQKPLPDRTNIVLSQSRAGLDYPNVSFVKSIDNALQVASNQSEEVYIIGGESVYEQFIGMADEMILSIVEEEVEDADAYFPTFDVGNWRVSKREDKGEFEVIHRERV